ncbi:hypothetical protein RJ639_038414 [Escallonia herrerae]|uniref:endo-1,4-beta-xylanase n=1 Tax=Escallonia herrerae TaxID=1293975 RepID=A0AA88WK60_9ASTE|nr:hypothetical protein RJ639_038414 [Escallonia herrerae]
MFFLAYRRESKCIEILVDKIVHEKSHMVSSVVEQFVGADAPVENIQPFSLHKIQEDPGNIIHNHDFSWGVDEPWKLMHREYTFIHRYGYKGIPAAAEGRTHFAWVKYRTEKWQGLEQEITSRVAPNTIYMLSACLRMLNNVQEFTKVRATVRMETPDKDYLSIGKTLIGGQQWEEMQGFTFCLPRKEGRLFFYFEGPPPQVDLLIASVALKEVERSTSGEDINIIQNPKFVEDGKQWARNMCRAEFNSSLGYAKTTNRVERSSGIEQDIGARLRAELVYELNVEVRVSGDNEADVYATLRIRRTNESRCKVIIARAPATNEKWVKLQGKFYLPDAPLTAVIRLEGSPPGTDIFVTGLRVCGHRAPSDLDHREELKKQMRDQLTTSSIIGNFASMIAYFNPKMMRSCMLEQFHAEPVEIYGNKKDRKCQGYQEAIITVAEENPDDKTVMPIK